MRAITIRKVSDNSLVAFGPENGMYDPSYTPGSAVRAVEPDYNAVLAEWTAKAPPVPDKRANLLSNPAVPQWFKDFIS